MKREIEVEHGFNITLEDFANSDGETELLSFIIGQQASGLTLEQVNELRDALDEFLDDWY